MQVGVADLVQWRWRDYGKPWLKPHHCKEAEEPWEIREEASRKVFELPGEFLIGLSASIQRSGDEREIPLEVEYGITPDGPWFSVASKIFPADGSIHMIDWPDVGHHSYWRVTLLKGVGLNCSGIVFYSREFKNKLTEQDFGKLDDQCEQWNQLTKTAQVLANRGVVVLGNNTFLEQLYHESDLLGWGAPIPFPCFLTVWAKRSNPHDFATLAHRFVRGPRAPVLVMSGKSTEARNRLLIYLKELLRPEFASQVTHLDDPNLVLAELWRRKEAASVADDKPPTLEDINYRNQQMYELLQVPEALRQDTYRVQFNRRDPFMLLLTKHSFGTWAPNRVFEEIQGYDIFRTYAEFTCVDGIICDDDAVWLHKPCDFYVPSPDCLQGDKRTDSFFDLLEKQRPYINALLDNYEQRETPLIPRNFRDGLEQGLLSAPPKK